MTDSRPVWRKALPVIGIGIGLFVFVFFILELGGPSDSRIRYLALIVSLGGIFGTSLAFDGRSAFSVADMPVARSIVSSLFGSTAGLTVWQWHQDTPLILLLFFGATIGALLGWSGYSWAKYIDP